MSDPKGRDAPSDKDLPASRHKAARTTIVGGQPAGNERDAPPIPVALEHILGLAAVSPSFAKELRQRRASALNATGLELTPSERAILGAVPDETLSQMISRMDRRLPEPDRRTFLEHAALAMAALVGGGVLGSSGGCKRASRDRSQETRPPADKGIRPDRLREEEEAARPGERDSPDAEARPLVEDRPTEDRPAEDRPTEGEQPSPARTSQGANLQQGETPDMGASTADMADPAPRPTATKPRPRPEQFAPTRGSQPHRPKPRPRPDPYRDTKTRGIRPGSGGSNNPFE